MTLVLSARDVALLERANRLLVAPPARRLHAWWNDTSATLLELFEGDHAMCMLPHAGVTFATHIEQRVLADIAKIVVSPEHVRAVDPIYFRVDSANTSQPRAVWNRLGALREAVKSRRESSPLYEVFRSARFFESANVDLVMPHGRASLCVSFERPGPRVERARSLAFVLAPAFETGARALAARPSTIVDERLTPREREIAARLIARQRNLEIAASLGLSAHTVRHHIESIFAKLGVRSRDDIASRVRFSP